MSDALEKVMRVVDEVTDPKKMSKAAYKDFLEDLVSDLESRLGAVTHELEREAKEAEDG